MSDLVILLAIYSFLGWVTEVVYAFHTRGHFVNRGFLHGPFCPIYGISLTIIVILFQPIEGSLLGLFVYSFILTSVIEYVTSLVMERAFNSKWWDYSDEKFNIQGRVCLKFSIYWGAAAILIYKLVHPLVMGIVNEIPQSLAEILARLLLGLLLVDLAFTMNSLTELRGITNRLGNLVEKAKSIKLTEAERVARLKSTLLEYESVRAKLNFNHNRLLKAFPNFKKEGFELMIEDIKRELEELKEEIKKR